MPPVSADSASPMSSSAPSPTEQLRLLAASAEERRSLRPIGTERSSKKSSSVPLGGSAGGMGGPLGFGGMQGDVGSSGGLWSIGRLSKKPHYTFYTILLCLITC